MVKITIEYYDKEYSTTKSETITKDKILISEIGYYAEKLLKECKLEIKELKTLA